MMSIFLLAVATLQGSEMIAVRKSEDRGHSEHGGWLNTNYTFSFADYHDPKFMGFRSLRVINEDIIAPKMGFDTHPHNNMEIITYIIDGTIEHKDTLGNISQIKTGEFQIQSAGTGIEHSEYNPSKKSPVHLLQIWIHPEKKNLTPDYQQKSFANHRDGLLLVASRDHGPLTVHQDVKIYLGRLATNREVDLHLESQRYTWVQMIKGKVEINGVILTQGDGAKLSELQKIKFISREESEFLVFDLK